MTEVNQYIASATLGGGCFWCLEAVYEQMQGVQSVVSGYMGGTILLGLRKSSKLIGIVP